MPLEIKIPDKLLFFLTESAPYKVAYGGRGSAKSTAAADSLLIKASQRRTRVMCAREYQNSIAESVHYLLESRIEALGLKRFFTVQRDLIASTVGSEIFFVGLHNVRNLKSTEGVDICWIEEAESVTEESWATLLPTIRADDSEIWITFNRQNEDDPTSQRWIEHPPPDAIVREVNWNDNPFFPDKLRKQMEHAYKVDPESAAHVWGGAYRTRSDAQVFKGKYSIDTFEPGKDWGVPLYGVDWGFSQDPTVGIKAWTHAGKLYIEHEVCEIGVETTNLPQFFDNIPGMRSLVSWADCSRPETINHMNNNGYPLMFGAKKWSGSIEDGIEHMRGYDAIIIHPRCRNIANEFRLYRYKTDRLSNKVLTEIVDANNHCIAARTRVITHRGNVYIENVVVGDMVLTRYGYRKVLRTMQTDINRPVLQIRTTNGAVRCTPDHPVFVIGKGFTRADAIRYNDVLIIAKAAEWKASNTMDCGTIDTQNPRTEVNGCTSNGLLSGYIARFGKMLMESFQRDTIFIISTKTLRTIRSVISNAYLRLNITKNIQCRTNERKYNENYSQKLTLWQRRGIVLQKDWHFIARLVHYGKKTSYQSILNASNVETNSNNELITVENDFVRTNVNQRIDGHLESTISPKNAQHVGDCSFVTDIQNSGFAQENVLSISDDGIAAAVYDLTVDGVPEFFAGGILVHNCIDAIRYALNNKIQILAGKTEPLKMW